MNHDQRMSEAEKATSEARTADSASAELLAKAAEIDRLKIELERLRERGRELEEKSKAATQTALAVSSQNSVLRQTLDETTRSRDGYVFAAKLVGGAAVVAGLFSLFGGGDDD